MTVSGYSAGGRAITVLLTSPLSRGLFHRAVCFSSGFLVCEQAPSRRIFAERFAPLAVEDGVRKSKEEAETWLLSEKEEDRKTARQWLYSLTGSRLVDIFPPAWGRMELFPIFFRDGTVVPSASIYDAHMNHVPVLIFYSTDEFSFEDVASRFDADTSVSEESKAFIAANFFNHRIFSREWDARYGNPPPIRC